MKARVVEVTKLGSLYCYSLVEAVHSQFSIGVKSKLKISISHVEERIRPFFERDDKQSRDTYM